MPTAALLMFGDGKIVCILPDLCWGRVAVGEAVCTILTSLSGRGKKCPSAGDLNLV